MAARRTIYWFRRDLRLADNPALLEAVRRADGDVTAVFIIDEVFVAPAGSTRVEYLRRTIESLSESMGGRLNILLGDPSSALLQVAREVRATQVVATGDFAPRGRERDERVRRDLVSAGIDVEYIDSPYVVAPGTVLTQSGSACRVFGAFRRSWEREALSEPVAAPHGVPWRSTSSVSLDELSARAARRRPWYFADLPDEAPTVLFGAGERSAHEQLDRFRAAGDAYDEARNFPGVEATSRLSPYLRFGSLHPRQVLAGVGDGSKGRTAHRTEICWREFYADVLFHRPESVTHVLRPSLEHLRVDVDERAAARFAMWAKGETGYPLVDAGMRQLLQEGWMHNRVRMVCASFLVKHLHLDWRWGARWFMWRLIDGDVASNQHGWQWTAGTGTDAAPFHRIFNPTVQAQRFDPDGAYVHKYVSELAGVDAPHCLQPGGANDLLSANYAPPMVDIGVERQEALARFAEAREFARSSR